MTSSRPESVPSEPNLQRILDLHSKLARRIKEYEQTVDLFPPIEVLNEIRYAFRAFLQFWQIENKIESNAATQEDSHAREHELQKTYHALVCAYHDLVDGLIIDVGEMLKRLTEKYPEATFEVLGPKRIAMLDDLNEVDAKIAESREKPSERIAIYELQLYDRWYTTLLDYRKSLDRTLIPEVIKRQQELNQKKRLEERRYTFTLALTIGGLILAIGSLALAVLALL